MGISGMSRDGEIMDAVLRAIRSNASVPDSITPEVDNSWVTLRGEADLRCESKAAVRAAASVPGAKGVTNEIKVLSRPPIPRRDGRSIDRR